MELNQQQYQFLEDLNARAPDPERRWVSVADEEAAIISPLRKESYIFIKNGQARITSRGINKLEGDAGLTKKLDRRARIASYTVTEGLDTSCELCRIQSELLDYFEQKYPEIKHVRAIRLIRHKLNHK